MLCSFPAQAKQVLVVGGGEVGDTRHCTPNRLSLLHTSATGLSPFRQKKKKKNESAPVAVDESRDLPRVSAESTGPARLPEKRAKSVLGGIPSSDSS